MSEPAKLVVFISGRGSNFIAIHEAILNGLLDAHISLVVTDNPQAEGLKYAKKHGIQTSIVDPKKHDNKTQFNQALIESVNAHCPEVDWIVLAGFMRILKSNFIEAFFAKILNIHPSLLPKYKGLNTHQKAIENGDNTHGCTVHFVTEDLDSGAKIGQSVVKIDANDTTDSLSSKVLKNEHKLYYNCINYLIKNTIKISSNKDNKTIVTDRSFKVNQSDYENIKWHLNA